MRLFIAIPLSEEVRNCLGMLRDELHDRASSGTFVSSESLHITLEFLGECTPPECDKAISAMQEVSFEPFTISIAHTGAFHRSDGDICWVGVEENKALSRLHDDLARALRAQGFRLERERFKAHITLSRRVKGALLPSSVGPWRMKVNSFSLMLSERGAHGMVYTPVFSVSSASTQGTIE